METKKIISKLTSATVLLSLLITAVAIEYVVFYFGNGGFLFLYKINNSLIFLILCPIVAIFCLRFYFIFFSKEENNNDSEIKLINVLTFLVAFTSLIIGFMPIVRKFDANNLCSTFFIIDICISLIIVVVVRICAYFSREKEKEKLYAGKSYS
jgi:uncharacterized membrane protein